VASLMEMWTGLSDRAKVGIGVGVAMIVALTIGLGIWAYRAEYQVLFADIPTRDAASMTAELDRMKVPYQLADGGNTILVPKDMVYKTRLKLMGKDIPLHGAVGFEVFNNADFGMTEFVQKVNYQRAIQGELTRTILSIEDIQSARVHLAIPEQGLFKKAMTKPKASVTVSMKQGRVLAPDQIAGIQRLVAASVPDIVGGDVTIVDQHGVALTRVAASEAGTESANTQLDSKRSTEDYLVRKVMQVLDRTFGPGQAIASVDVVLNLDQSRITTEEVLPAKRGAQDGSPAGVIVRERQTIRETGSMASPAAAGLSGRSGQNGNVTSIESDFQVGRRVEQVVSATGSLRRMTVAVVVKKSLSDAQIEDLKEVIALAIGFNSQRGDAVVVRTVGKVTGADGASPDSAVPNNASLSDAAMEKLPTEKGASMSALPNLVIWIIGVLLVAVTAGGVGYIWLNRKNRVSRKPLSQVEREEMLINVRQWIHGPQKTEEGL
jgi:flagellar M-ring protein FliF